MNTIRIITTVVIGTLGLGLLGCSWADAQFEWPWRRQNAPVTHPSWASNEAWAKPTTRPGDNTVTTQQATTQPTVPVKVEPLKIGRTREITTSVLPIKGKFITVQEILHSAKPRLSAIADEPLSERRVRAIINRAIGRRINNELVFAEADARLEQSQKDHVDVQVADIRRNMIANAGGSEARLKQSLLDNSDITLDEVMEDHRRRLTVQLYQQIKFLPAISITRQMLLGYYTQHKADFRVEKKVAMQLIAVLIQKLLPEEIANDPTQKELDIARAAAKERIDQAEKLLKDGKTFTKVAKQFSDIKRDTGGKLPLWPAGSLRQKKVEQAAFTLKLGERSGILETAPVKKDGLIVNFGGLYIVKAYEIQEGRVTSFEDAQEGIGKILREKQLDILSAKFSERLNKEARIPQSSEFIETAVDEAINLYWPVDKP
jgi:hypothetical protein